MALENKKMTEDALKPTPDEGPVMNNLRIWKNLVTLSLGVVIYFSGYMALTNLQSTLNSDGDVGVISQSVIYTTSAVTSLFLPKLTIKKIGCKATIVLSFVIFIPYIVGNCYSAIWTLIPTAVIHGIGTSILWSALNTYMNDLSFLHAKKDADRAKLSTSKFFGIFQMFFQTTQIWGNAISFFVLKESDGNLTQYSLSLNDSIQTNFTCGANFCGGVTNQKMAPPTDEKRFILIGIDVAFTAFSVLLLAIFLDSVKKPEGEVDDNVLSNLAATLNQMKKVDQLLLIVISTFVGLQQGFIYGDYTKSYIACAWGLEYVGLVFVSYGIVSAIMCAVTGYLVKFVPRAVQIIAAAACNIGVCIALFFWQPTNNVPSTFFIIVSFWALSDAVWQTQIPAFYGILFRDDEEAAFANFRLWEAVGLTIAFTCSSLICTSSKIYMELIFLVLGVIGYTLVELRIMQRIKPCAF